MIDNTEYTDRIPLPAGLFEPRQRKVFSKMGPGWPSEGRIGLAIPPLQKNDAIALGARRESFGQLSIARLEAVRSEFQPFVPFIACKDYVPLRIEMIPQSSWAASLKNLLSEADWKSLRDQANAHSSRICEICGDGSKAPECHELWEYRAPADKADWGVQKLCELLCLCHECHEMFHPGLANVNGRGKVVSERIGMVNGWDASETSRWARWSTEVFQKRSKMNWALDLSAIRDFGVVNVNERWKRSGQDGMIATNFSRDYGGETRTKIIGVEWTIGNEPLAENRM